MSLKDTFRSILGLRSAGAEETKGFEVLADSSALNFYVDRAELEALEQGDSGSSLKLVQLVLLNMLHEQGLAERFPNGFKVSQDTVAHLDEEQADLLRIPALFPGSFACKISGRTGNGNFDVRLDAILNGMSCPFTRKGPLIYLTEDECYRLTPPQVLALGAWDEHRSISIGTRPEADNVRLMAKLQAAQQAGMRLDLAHFERLDVVVPDKIGVVAVTQADGSLNLSPSVSEGITPEDLNSRWGQIDPGAESGALRVGNRVVLFDSEKLEAAREVLKNRRIPADKVKDFIATPSAFINAALVNLDIGFSLRVEGIGKLVHIDFGNPDSVRRDWFAIDSRPDDPASVQPSLATPEDIARFEEKYHEAAQQGANVMEWDGRLVDISDSVRVDQLIAGAKEALNQSGEKKSTSDRMQSDSKERVSFLLKQAEEVGNALLEKAEKAQDMTIGWDRYARDPFPHQKDGVSWMRSLLEQALEDDHDDVFRIQGALLADDMGLGKTYMTLVTLGEFLETQKLKGQQGKPVLVVAPLSLLENWEDEVFKTFKSVPFRDVVVLQSGRDLKKFRVKGSERESVQSAAALDHDGRLADDSIRYALHVGPEAGQQRLDMDRRLVLTTYQTLRDYQFSLCCIDWGVVIFDEAQNIKNPNTLQTRAAKGLKADFKLLATGTPVENSLGDFWCLMDTAQPGLLGDWSVFRDKWLKPILDASPEERDLVRIDIGSKLREAVGRFMLRRTKEEQLKALPKKFIYSGVAQSEASTVVFDPTLARSMRGVQLEYYDEVLDDYRKQHVTEDMRGRALAALQKLRSLSLHPKLGQEQLIKGFKPKEATEVLGESAKLQVMRQVLDQIKKREEKVILFMMTKRLQMLLKCCLDSIYGLNISIINGDTATTPKKSDVLSRKGLIEKFEQKPGFNILIMSPIAAGVGLTVVGANHVIHVERHWNPAKEAQATDRVYRIGQTKDVHIHMPASLHPQYDSFDVNIDRLLRGKLMLKDAVVTSESVSETEIMQSMGL